MCTIEIEIEIYPLQKDVVKDIISPMGCNSLVLMCTICDSQYGMVVFAPTVSTGKLYVQLDRREAPS
jgi:hypothetical protein